MRLNRARDSGFGARLRFRRGHLFGSETAERIVKSSFAQRAVRELQLDHDTAGNELDAGQI